MLSEALFIFLMHIMKVMECFSSNRCLFLQHITSFPVMIPQGNTLNLSFWVKFESEPRLKQHGVTHNWPQDALRSSLYLPCISGEEYETLQQQLTPFYISRHHTSHEVRLPQIWHFVFNLRVDLSKNDMMRITSRSKMLIEVSPTILIHLRKIMKHFSSNGCPYLQYMIPFSVMVGYPKSYILCAI